MHVLIVCEYGTINGGERSLLAVLDQCPSDVAVTVLAPAEGRLSCALSAQHLTHVPFSLFDSTGHRLPIERVVETLSHEVERLAPNIVHANSLSMGRITGRLSELVSVPCTAHVRDILRVSRTAASHLNGNDRLIAVSEATRAFHIAQAIDAERITVIYNGIDCEEWQPRPGAGQLRNELQIPDGAMVALTVGQIGVRKGLDVLVEAALRQADALPQLHYVVLGERTSGKAESIAFERSLHDLLSAAEISDRFHWLGYRDDVGRLLSDADLLIHAARQEPFGRVLLEAAACRLPIVATHVGGTAEMLTDEESTLLVEPDDVAALGNALQRLTSNADLRMRLGAAARKRVVQRFDIRERAQDLFHLWRSIADG